MKRLLMSGVAVAVAVSASLLGRPPAPRTVKTPVSDAPSSEVERGRLVYARYGCATCHGLEGTGGFANPNSETDGKVPGLQYVSEGYTKGELARLILDGTTRIGKADPKGPVPPYRMPGWRDGMSPHEVAALTEYLFSLYPESAKGSSWR